MKKSLLLVLPLAVCVRLWVAWTDQGIIWPDEIYQSLEPAHHLAFGYGFTAWEFVDGARSWVFPGLLAAVCVLVLGASAASGTKWSDELSQSWSPTADDVAVGRWLRSQARGMRLMDTQPTLAYYAGSVLVPYPDADAATALRYIEHQRVADLVFRASDGSRRPYLSDWLQRVPDERMELVKTFEGRFSTIRVFRWRGAGT